MRRLLTHRFTVYFVLNRYGGLTVGNIQKSIPASFGERIPPMVRKIAVRRSAQVKLWTLNWSTSLQTRRERWLTDQHFCVQVLYNNKGYHSMPTYLNVLNNAILRANLPASKGNPAAYGKNKLRTPLCDVVCVCICISGVDLYFRYHADEPPHEPNQCQPLPGLPVRFH